MRRGQLCRIDDDWYVVVSADTLNRLLPTCWALLVIDQPGQLQPPLVVAVPAGSAGDHPDLWVRTTQIRTIVTAAATPVGLLPAQMMGSLDRVLVRLVGLGD